MTKSLQHEWDAANRLKKVSKDTSSGTPQETSYTYDAAGNLDEMLYGNELKHTYAQDEMNRLTSVTLTQGATDKAFFDYNPSDRPLALTGQRMAARETVNLSQTALFRRDINYYYDPLRRLNKENATIPAENTMVGNPGGEISYETQPSAESTTGYDLVGNRRSRNVSTAELQNVGISDYDDQEYDAKDRLLGDPEVLFSYDVNGNTLQGMVSATNAATLPATVKVDDQYDFENHLVLRTVTDGAGTPTAWVGLIYDGDGNRIKKTITNIFENTIREIYYVVDDRNPSGYPRVIEEYRADTFGAAAQVDRSYTYGHRLISQTLSIQNPEAGTYFYGYDGHGSVRFLSDEQGNITDTYVYDAFENLIGHEPSNPASLTPNNYLFACEYLDFDLGVYYVTARYYNPQTGRFWTMDSFEGHQNDPLSLHKYLYAHADPVNNVDPSGYLIVGSNLIYGQRVHREIGAHFVSSGAGRYYSQPISTILGIPWRVGFSASQPDLVQAPQAGAPGRVFEIKAAGSFVAGATQLTYYLGLLNGLDPLRRSWLPGGSGTYTPPRVINLGTGAFAIISPPASGIILYQVIDFKQAAVAIAAYGATRLQLQLSFLSLRPSFAF